jgi:hypothetical protein
MEESNLNALWLSATRAAISSGACCYLFESLSVIARERSDEAIPTKLLKAFAWIGSQGE